MAFCCAMEGPASPSLRPSTQEPTSLNPVLSPMQWEALPSQLPRRWPPVCSSECSAPPTYLRVSQLKLPSLLWRGLVQRCCGTVCAEVPLIWMPLSQAPLRRRMWAGLQPWNRLLV